MNLLQCGGALCLILVALPAQKSAQGVLGGLGVDERSRNQVGPGGFRLPHGDGWGLSGVGVSPANPLQAIEQYWQWNRARFLPSPKPSAGLPAADPVAASTTASPVTPGVERSWLRAAATAQEPAVRAAVLRTYGGMGPAGDGLRLLLDGLCDAAPEVQQAAALGLGEHGGPQARFALVRLLGDSAQSELLRSSAAIGLGIASRIDGIGHARELHRAALVEGLPQLREAVCAAVALSGDATLQEDACGWFRSRAFPVPAAAILCAAAGQEQRAATMFLRPWLFGSDAAIRIAALAAGARSGGLDAIGFDVAYRQPAPTDQVNALLAAASWVGFTEACAKKKLTPEVALGLALGIHARDWVDDKPWLAVAALDREHHVAEERPVWLLAAALANDPSAEARARLVLQDGARDETWRLFAVEAAGITGGAALDSVRRAALLDPSLRVRWAAASVCARHATDEDLETLRYAANHTEAPDERAALLVALGQTRRGEAGPCLRRFAGEGSVSDVVRLAAWRGIGNLLHRSGRSPLLAMGERGGHLWLPHWLLKWIAAAH